MQQSRQNPALSQSDILTNPFPHQGFVAAQPQQGQVVHPPQPSGPSDYEILMMNSEEVNTSDINLQTRS